MSADRPERFRALVERTNARDAGSHAIARRIGLSRCAVGGVAADRTGLVPIENNCRDPLAPSGGSLDRPEAVQIDSQARRVRKMAGTMEHAMRLSEFAQFRLGGFSYTRLFLTFTYRPDCEWKPEHISAYVRRLRDWCKARNFPTRFTWVAEMQQRGVIHYHLVTWIPKRFRLPKPDECYRDKQGRTQSPMWPHGDSNLQRIKSGCVGVMAYLKKYMSKMSPDAALSLPKGARMYGHGGLDREQRREVRYRVAPYWVREALGTFADIRRTLGGWVDKLTGEFLRSPWRVRVDGAGQVWAFRVAV